MSIFNIFGAPPKKPTEPVRQMSINETINDIRQQIIVLEKRCSLLEEKVTLCVKTAKTKINTDKNGAILELNKKKAFEEDINKTRNIIFNLELQLLSLESANVNKRTFDVIKNSNLVLQKTNGSQDNDKVNDLMDSLDDQFEITKSISDSLSRPIGRMLDESDLSDELELLKEHDNTIEATLDLPEVATGKISVNPKTTDEDDEEETIKKLQASMA
jgi:charged multivesicular body protein 4